MRPKREGHEKIFSEKERGAQKVMTLDPQFPPSLLLIMTSPLQTVKIKTFTRLESGIPQTKSHLRALGGESVLVYNKQHTMEGPLAPLYPKYPNTTLPTACRLCVCLICAVGLRRRPYTAVYTGTTPFAEPSDLSKRRGTPGAV